MAVSTYKWTIDKWHELVDSGVLDGQKVELLEGEIIDMSPEGIPHRNTSHETAKYLRKLLGESAEVYEAHPITLDNSEPEPDIAIVRSPSTIYRDRHPYEKDIYWLIEVANRSLKKDLEQKTITYARNNIPEYWVIDLVNRKLIVHINPYEDKYLQIDEYKSGAIAPQAFPKIKISLERIFLY